MDGKAQTAKAVLTLNVFTHPLKRGVNKMTIKTAFFTTADPLKF